MGRKEEALHFFEAQKEYVEPRVRADIEYYRKNNARLSFTDTDGKPVEGVTVEIEQKSHEFRFGANLFMLDELETDEKNAIYREKFAKLFNIATLPFYWESVEPEKGKYRFDKNSPKLYRRPPIDLCMEYCEEKGIEPKCHCLNYDQFSPKWASRLTTSELKRELDHRFRVIAERYADRIPSFEVTNEAMCGYLAEKRFDGWCDRSSFYWDDDFVEWSFRTAERYFPNNHLIINDFYEFSPGTYTKNSLYYRQIENLLRNGVRNLDAIGMQFHSFFPQAQEKEKANERYNPETLLRLFDLYARLGKKLQITEMTIPAYSDQVEDEDVQAELLRHLYPLFFSHPAMEAVIYWNLVDGYAAFAPMGDMTVGENVYYGGLLRHDMSEKPAYRVLYDLIHNEWHTSLSAEARNGVATVRGFCGDYDLKIYHDGKCIPKSIRLSANANNYYDFVL